MASVTTPPPKPPAFFKNGAFNNAIEPAFTNAYFRHFSDGGSLEQLCQDIYQKFVPPLQAEQKKENLLIAKHILTTARQGYESYLQSTLWAKFQNVLSFLFGMEFAPDEGMSHINAKLKGLDSILDPIIIAELKVTNRDALLKQMKQGAHTAQIIMARTFTSMLQKPLYFPVEYSPNGDSTLPSRILLTHPEEKDAVCTFNPTETAKGEGVAIGGRRYYQGKVHQRDGRKEPIGILTTAPTTRQPKTPLETYRIEYATRETRQESDLLKSLNHKHITPAGSYFSATVNQLNLSPSSLDNSGSVTIGFRITQFNRWGDLLNFMQSAVYKNMPDVQKLEFMEALLLACNYLHRNGFIHRDIKTKNIVVVENQGRYEPILIDFTTCISPNYRSDQFTQRAGTPVWWPPEYVKVIRNAEDKLKPIKLLHRKDNQLYEELLSEELTTEMPKVTKAAMDVWGLGLIFFHFFYGQDLISEILDGKNEKLIYETLTTDFPRFINAINSKRSNNNEKWEKIRLRIQQERKDCPQGGAWDKIIRPMLLENPEQRHKTSQLLKSLRELKNTLLIAPSLL